MTNSINNEDTLTLNEDTEYTLTFNPTPSGFLLAVPEDGIYIIEIPDCKKSIPVFLKAGQIIKIREEEDKQ